MKKLFLVSLAAIMVLSLAACGDSASSTEATTAATTAATATESTATEATSEAQASLVDITTDIGISMKLPNDMTLQDVNGTQVYLSTDKHDVASFGVGDDTTGASLSEQKEETYTDHLKLNNTNVVVKKFENNIQIDGKDAIEMEISFTTAGGNDVTMTQAVVKDDTKIYTINLTYAGDNSSALAQNAQACIDSITIAPAQ